MKRIVVTCLVVAGAVAVVFGVIAAKRVETVAAQRKDTKEAITQLNTLLVGRFGQEQLARMVESGAYKLEGASKPQNTFIFQYTVNNVRYTSVVADGQWIEIARTLATEEQGEAMDDHQAPGASE